MHIHPYITVVMYTEILIDCRDCVWTCAWWEVCLDFLSGFFKLEGSSRKASKRHEIEFLVPFHHLLPGIFLYTTNQIKELMLQSQNLHTSRNRAHVSPCGRSRIPLFVVCVTRVISGWAFLNGFIPSKRAPNPSVCILL